MSEILTIYEDHRPIKSIHTEQEAIYAEAEFEITRIEPYLENGEMASVIWFALYHNETLIRRVNGKFVESVCYRKES